VEYNHRNCEVRLVWVECPLSTSFASFLYLKVENEDAGHIVAFLFTTTSFMSMTCTCTCVY
jgi:hypothetical protein